MNGLVWIWCFSTLRRGTICTLLLAPIMTGPGAPSHWVLFWVRETPKCQYFYTGGFVNWFINGILPVFDLKAQVNVGTGLSLTGQQILWFLLSLWHQQERRMSNNGRRRKGNDKSSIKKNNASNSKQHCSQGGGCHGCFLITRNLLLWNYLIVWKRFIL